MTSQRIARRRQAGMTLVEVLVALLVLSIGLLGIAALQTTGLRATQASGARSQAVMLSYDIIDRMRANRQDAIAGDYDTVTSEDFAADPGAAPPGMPGDDLIAWKTQLAATLPEGRGAIVRAVGNPALVTVTVEWVDRDDNRDADAQLLQFQTTTRL
ncbi:MAG: type IV pilus modification protein PilV [Steroidobacteraceae bacterium]|jgi:type IV pilus assembly protein PilV|nr:type IV pilus modification protein PilV [Steroidobacteraceae bacterium]